MECIINITTKTRPGDSYDEVAVNKYPIIWLAEESLESLYSDEEFIARVKELLKSKTFYDNAKLYIRTFEDWDLKDEISFPVKEKINLDYDTTN